MFSILSFYQIPHFLQVSKSCGFSMFVLVQVLYFVDVKNLALRSCFQSSAWLHQTSVCHGLGMGHMNSCQEGSSRLQSEVPAEEVDLALDASRLPSSASCSRGAHVSNTSFGEELSFSSLLWAWSPGHEKLDLQPLQVSGVMCAHVIWCFYKELCLSCKCRRSVVWKKAGDLFSCVLTTEVVSPSRNNWLGNWCLSSMCSQILYSPRFTEAKDSVRPLMTCKCTKWITVLLYAAVVQRIVFFPEEIAEYWRLLPCLLDVCMSLEFISNV